jgi:uncharacterized protein (DUF1810 family)
MNDPYNLERFILAQNFENAYENALREMRRGRKTSHWMWFIFPQMTGLGRSFMARKYAIRSLAEAQEYLRHPLLGDRLVEATEALGQVDASTVEGVFGSTDTQKLQSSLTLFALASGEADSIFDRALARCFDGERDSVTAGLVQDVR